MGNKKEYQPVRTDTEAQWTLRLLRDHKAALLNKSLKYGHMDNSLISKVWSHGQSIANGQLHLRWKTSLLKQCLMCQGKAQALPEKFNIELDTLQEFWILASFNFP